jgi:hypothetical protein
MVRLVEGRKHEPRQETHEGWRAQTNELEGRRQGHGAMAEIRFATTGVGAIQSMSQIGSDAVSEQACRSNLRRYARFCASRRI